MKQLCSGSADAVFNDALRKPAKPKKNAVHTRSLTLWKQPFPQLPDNLSVFDLLLN
jgi:hypothetical protein